MEAVRGWVWIFSGIAQCINVTIDKKLIIDTMPGLTYIT